MKVRCMWSLGLLVLCFFTTSWSGKCRRASYVGWHCGSRSREAAVGATYIRQREHGRFRGSALRGYGSARLTTRSARDSAHACRFPPCHGSHLRHELERDPQLAKDGVLGRARTALVTAFSGCAAEKIACSGADRTSDVLDLFTLDAQTPVRSPVGQVACVVICRTYFLRCTI